METLELVSAYDRPTNPPIRRYRRLTLAEIRALSGHALVIRNDGKVAQVKINGAVKTWKRDPSRVEVPVKYGLYEYARFDTAEALRRFVTLEGESC